MVPLRSSYQRKERIAQQMLEGFRARVRGIPGSRQSCERTGAFGMDLFCG